MRRTYKTFKSLNNPSRLRTVYETFEGRIPTYRKEILTGTQIHIPVATQCFE